MRKALREIVGSRRSSLPREVHEPVAVPKQSLPKVHLKSLRIAQPASPSIPAPSAEVPTSPVPEISRKLRELIGDQRRRYEAFVHTQNAAPVQVHVDPTQKQEQIKDARRNDPEEEAPIKACDNSGLVTVIEELDEGEQQNSNTICEDPAALTSTPSCSIKIRRKKKAPGKSSMAGCAAETSRGLNCISRGIPILVATADTIKVSSTTKQEENESMQINKKRQSTIELDTDLEDSVETTKRSGLQESLVELLKSIDLRAAQHEISSGFLAKSKDETDKTRQIAKIRSRIQKRYAK